MYALHIIMCTYIPNGNSLFLSYDCNLVYAGKMHCTFNIGTHYNDGQHWGNKGPNSMCAIPRRKPTAIYTDK